MEKILDGIFADESTNTTWQHHDLRTVFDKYSSEWNETSIEEKVRILKKIAYSGEKLSTFLIGYKTLNIQKGRRDLIENIDDALIEILEVALKNN
jgi:hypothetical protein